MVIYFILSFFILISDQALPDKKIISQFRGPGRNGHYPEKNLLKKWPEKGPHMVWSYEGLGSGHGSVSISDDKIFVLGMTGTKGNLYTLDINGKILRKQEYGEEWHETYGGSRSTPTVAGDLLYFESGHGVIYCFNTKTGKQVWALDILKKFNAQNITWGMAESLLIDGDRLFCTPGGPVNNIAALNRFTGETIWTSEGNHQPAAYCSPLIFRHNKSTLLVTMTAASIVCVDAITGKFYWQVPQFQSNKIHANSPVYSNGYIYCVSQTGRVNSGMTALRLSDDGKSVHQEWRNQEISNLMGGFIIKDGYIYIARYQRKAWNCVDIRDGKIVYTTPGFGDGVIITADGLFYCYNEQGEMALVDATPSLFNVISRFKVPLGTNEHWSHPVIHKGRLYVRHGNSLMVYNVSSEPTNSRSRSHTDTDTEAGNKHTEAGNKNL